MRKSAFTLTELLVVMAIIALLSALLFSVFARAREKGRSATCQSNLKQIGLAVQQYTQDNSGSLPNSEGGYSKQSDYPLYTYLKTLRVFQCPSAETKPTTSIPAFYNFDYSFNMNLRKIVIGLPLLGTEEMKIADVSRTIMSGDGYLFNDDDSFKGYYVGQAEGRGSLRHSGGANYLFCDYHVKWFRPEQTGFGVSCRTPEAQTLAATYCVDFTDDTH